jgi:hypothetical protein
MRFQNYLNKELITEVFIYGQKDAKPGDNIIAFRQHIWIIRDKDDFKDQIDDIKDKLRLRSKYDDVNDLMSDIRETGPDIISGYITNDKYLSLISDQRQGSESKTLLKVIKGLKLRGIEIDTLSYNGNLQDSYREERYEYTNKLSNKTFYHGTNTSAMPQIFVTGLRPQTKSNWTKITHDDKVFVTLNKEEAYFHAMTSAEKSNSFPFIIELKIPDPDKLVLDYDIAIEYYGSDHSKTKKLGYSDIHEYVTGGAIKVIDKPAFMKRQSDNKEDLNTKFGIFGYIGRIPANNFKNVISDDDAYREWVVADYMDGDTTHILDNIQHLRNWYSMPIKDFKELGPETIEEYEEEMSYNEEEDD